MSNETLPKIVITETLDPIAANWLSERANVVWSRFDRTEQSALDADRVLFEEVAVDADALVVRTYTQVNQALLDRCQRLKVIGRAGVGLDNFDLPACERAGVQVVYTPDANSLAVIDYVMGLLIQHYRPWQFMDAPLPATEFHQIRKTCVGKQLSELTLGILGYGRIGKRLGKVAQAMGMRVLAHDVLDDKELLVGRDDLTGAYPMELVSSEKLYNEADILTIHIDGRKENTAIVNQSVFDQLQRHCLVINAARGNLVNHDDLAAWLKQRETIESGGAAILDVHDPEPPTESNPLWGLSNCKLLPHLASRTKTAMLNMSWVVKDVLAVLNGEKPNDPAF